MQRSNESGVPIGRLRRRVLLERIVARLEFVDSGKWVLKGGMALEVRLANRARLTKDIDLALREEQADGDLIERRLVDALSTDPHNDRLCSLRQCPRSSKPTVGVTSRGDPESPLRLPVDLSEQCSLTSHRDHMKCWLPIASLCRTLLISPAFRQRLWKLST